MVEGRNCITRGFWFCTHLWNIRLQSSVKFIRSM